jgi:hypothetical protein
MSRESDATIRRVGDDPARWGVEAALAGACDGWRQWRRCVDEDGRQRRDPHPRCPAAQRRYVLAVLEQGTYPAL